MNTINNKLNMVYRLVNDSASNQPYFKKITHTPLSKVPCLEKVQYFFGCGPLNLHNIVTCCIAQKTTTLELSPANTGMKKTPLITRQDFSKFQLTCRRNGFVKYENLSQNIYWNQTNNTINTSPFPKTANLHLFR